MFSRFDEDTQKVLLMAKKEMLELKHPYVGSEHLLLSILRRTELSITAFLNKCGISYDNYREEIVKVIGVGKSKNQWFLYTPLLKRIIENAILDSKDDGKEVSVERLFVSLLEEGDGVANRILMGMNIDIDALYEKFSSQFLNKEHYNKNKLYVEDFAIDFNQKAQDGEFDPVVGRDDKINRMIEILLRRTKNNPLLIGDAGVGKTALVEELARRIVKGIVPRELKDKRILSVSIASLVAGTKYRGEFEERVNKIVEELEHVSNVILFIDEIHTIVGAGGAEGAIDASNILKPYLARGKIKIIGATTKAEYAKFLENDKAFDRRFQKILIEEPTLEDTKNILFHLKEIYENYHGIEISDEIITTIVELSNRYISIGKQPDKAIDLLDEACSKTAVMDTLEDKKAKKILLELTEVTEKKNQAIVEHDFKQASIFREQENFLQSQLNKLELKVNGKKLKKAITLDTIYEVIYDKTKIPVKQILSYNEKDISKQLKLKVVGQDPAIDTMVPICFSAHPERTSPISLLLVGKSGLGKTLLVKEYAKLLYSKDNFIKLDMSEYRDSYSVSKIIGSPPGYVGYSDKNTVLEAVKLHPYSVILLDEIEKAHPAVLKLFLQVLDDGIMTTSYGEKVSFQNCIVFMTSNLGTDVQSIGFVKNESAMMEEKIKSFLGVELLNRLDGIVYFLPFTEKAIDKIIKSKIKEQFPTLDESHFQQLFREIKETSQYEKFGARKIDKVIERKKKDINYVK